MGYASRTGTRRNIAALSDAGWGWMVGPLDMGGPILGGMAHALDNAAWVEFVTGLPWDEAAFLRAVELHGPSADFIVVPDKVGDAAVTRERIAKWLPLLAARCDIEHVRLLIAVQDGMTFEEVEQLAGGRIGIFIGGTTEWKLQAIIPWGRWAKARGIYCHVGRVNTARRIFLCAAGKVSSFDGTSATKYAKTLPLLEQAARQPDLLAGLAA